MKCNWKLFLTCSLVLTILPQLFSARRAPGLGKKKVLILGAGSAGITAAKTLYDQGITDFLVLEAQDYIGGRIKQVPFAGMKVEEGANWIHYQDEDDNPLNSLNEKYHLTGHLSNYSNVCMRLVNVNVLWKKAIVYKFECTKLISKPHVNQVRFV